MGGEHHRDAVLGHLFHDGGEELATGQGVEVGYRFVQQQQLGPLAQGDGQRHLGLLTPRESPYPLVERDTKSSEAVGGQRLIPSGVNPSTEVEHLSDAEVLIQGLVLGDETDPGELLGTSRRRAIQHGDPAHRGADQADTQMQQRGLAGTVGTDQPDDAPRGYRQRAVPQRPTPAVTKADPAGLNRAHATPANSSRTPRTKQGLHVFDVEAGRTGRGKPAGQLGLELGVTGHL